MSVSACPPFGRWLFFRKDDITRNRRSVRLHKTLAEYKSDFIDMSSLPIFKQQEQRGNAFIIRLIGRLKWRCQVTAQVRVGRSRFPGCRPCGRQRSDRSIKRSDTLDVSECEQYSHAAATAFSPFKEKPDIYIPHVRPTHPMLFTRAMLPYPEHFLNLGDLR